MIFIQFFLFFYNITYFVTIASACFIYFQVGIFLIFMCAAISSFTGTVLGRCWTILRDNKPKETQHCGDPYPTIGFHAFGKPGQ